MRKLIIANWKMNLGPSQALSLARDFKERLGGADAGRNVVVLPDFLNIAKVGEIFDGTGIILGAQDCYWEKKGAFTGEISASHLKELGCEYVLVGHSERRENLNETDKMVHKKIRASLEAGLTPILCVGENFEERREGQKEYVILRQVTKALEGIDVKPGFKVVVAYEPVWVIGSGQAISSDEAEHTHRAIYQTLVDLFDVDAARKSFRIIYGGSADRDGAEDFLKQPSVHGLLVGGASLDAEEFAGIALTSLKYAD